MLENSNKGASGKLRIRHDDDKHADELTEESTESSETGQGSASAIDTDVARAAGLQRALAEISQLALKRIALEDLFGQVAELVAEGLEAETVGVFELKGDGKVLQFAGGHGWPSNALRQKSIPTAVCQPLHEALSANKLIDFDGPQLGNLLRGHRLTGPGMALPMGSGAEHLGVMTVCGGLDGHERGDAETSFLHTVAFILSSVWEQRKTDTVLTLRNRALEALDQGIVITDAQRIDNPLIYVNPAFERLTGYLARQVIGKNPRFLRGAETKTEAVDKMRDAVRDGCIFRGTVLNYRCDGTPFWNDLTISNVRNADGVATHHVGILTDVSERVNLEAQLRQAQKMEAIGHLTGGIAHDFNNLLAVVLGNLEALLDEVKDPETRQTVELVMTTAERGALLTQRLLAFGRRQTLRPESVNIPAALDSLSDMLQRTLGEQVELNCRYGMQGHHAMIDRALFESAILNLAVNARDAMPDGGELRIDCCIPEASETPGELADGEFLMVSVHDNGTGMTPEVQRQAFEPFFTTKDVGAGSGLGLAMVYGFAKQSGGSVTIDSQVGVGTSVNLFLPKADEAAAASEVSNVHQMPLAHGSERILLVEDEAEVRRFVAKLLQRLGYSVIEAEDATSALNVLETVNTIDLIFSDMILPGGINGLKLIEQAKALRPDLRVLLTTGYTEEYERLMQSSPGKILKKPYRRRELATLLRETLDAA